MIVRIKKVIHGLRQRYISGTHTASQFLTGTSVIFGSSFALSKSQLSVVGPVVVAGWVLRPVTVIPPVDFVFCVGCNVVFLRRVCGAQLRFRLKFASHMR